MSQWCQRESLGGVHHEMHILISHPVPLMCPEVREPFITYSSSEPHKDFMIALDLGRPRK